MLKRIFDRLFTKQNSTLPKIKIIVQELKKDKLVLSLNSINMPIASGDSIVINETIKDSDLEIIITAV